MPKKASSWGQQEYVPQGNGDASGEYAKQSGSNAHFSAFKQPQEKTNIEIHDKGQYDIANNKATWNLKTAKDNWEDSQAGKFSPKYAKSYKVTMSPKDFLNLAYRGNVDELKVGDKIGGDPIKELDVDEFSKGGSRPMFLKIQFSKDKNNASVVGHEGRHRAFALMKAGINEMDVELQVDTTKNYDKYKPHELDKLNLVGQFNKEHKAVVNQPISMSYENYLKLDDQDKQFTNFKKGE